jgi:hypothetical protein
VIGLILGMLPLGLLVVCSLLVCTPAFFPTFLSTAGVFVLDVVGFLGYWWLVRRSANACAVVALYCYFALLFVFGVVLYFGSSALSVLSNKEKASRVGLVRQPAPFQCVRDDFLWKTPLNALLH